MEDVKRKFLPRFTALAKERIRQGLEIAATASGDDALHVARELHSLAGEAGLLGLAHLLPLARRAEEAATQLHASRDKPTRVALERALLDLHVAVCNVESKPESTPI
jgi:HPt (histidine-containing phosphotransfer) domain-containing protein